MEASAGKMMGCLIRGDVQQRYIRLIGAFALLVTYLLNWRAEELWKCKPVSGTGGHFLSVSGGADKTGRGGTVS